MGLILDSTILIAAERRGDTVERLIERVVEVAGDQEAALSAVGLTEFVHGIYRASAVDVRQRRQAYLDELLANLTVYPFPTRVRVRCWRVVWMANNRQQARRFPLPIC